MPASPTPPSRNELAARVDNPAGSAVLKKLSPTAPGAKRFAHRYCDALVCVHYREDATGRRRLTTVELIVDQRPIPSPPCVRVAWEEVALRQQIKAAGGVWDAKLKLWRLSKASIRALKLEHRVVSVAA